MKIVEIVRRSFELGDMPRAFFNGTLVIMPKDDVGGKRGLGLLETLHKLNSQITNLRMANAIIFSQDVHGFRRQRGTFTAIGEAKLRMQMATCKSKTIYQIYLDLSKAYDSIDRNRIKHMLRKCEVGPNLMNYIEKVWDNQCFTLRQDQFYSEGMSVDRGVTQGDINSPIIFNIIVDAMLRA